MHRSGEARLSSPERVDAPRPTPADLPTTTTARQVAQAAWSALTPGSAPRRAQANPPSASDADRPADRRDLVRARADASRHHRRRGPAITRGMSFSPLERKAPSILRSQRLGASGKPVWLPGVTAEIERVPLGTVLVIGPSNYPLFLPGVQVFQALAAGNGVIWKPGRGGRSVALVVANALSQAGLPEGLLVVTGEDTAAAEAVY